MVRANGLNIVDMVNYQVMRYGGAPGNYKPRSAVMSHLSKAQDSLRQLAYELLLIFLLRSDHITMHAPLGVPERQLGESQIRIW